MAALAGVVAPLVGGAAVAWLDWPGVYWMRVPIMLVALASVPLLARGRELEPFDRSIDIHIARLRRKIERDPEKPQSIRTVRGVGYMFVSNRG